MEIFVVVNNVITGLLLVFLIIKIYFCYITDKQIDILIDKHFGNLKMRVVDIYKLNFTEKIKYGVPLNAMIRFYGYFITFFSLKIKPVRKVELIDEKNIQYTKYIELVIKSRKLVSLNEFDFYDF